MFQALRKIVLANPMGIFIGSILAKWYVMVMVGTLVVTFWVFKSLDKIHFFSYANTTMASIFDQTKSVARYCIPKLGGEGDKIINFWNCLGNPPKYEDNDVEATNLKNNLDRLINTIGPNDSQNSLYQNPYDDDNDNPK